MLRSPLRVLPRAILVLLLIVAAGADVGPALAQRSRELLPGVYALDGLLPYSPDDDLAPLDDLVGDARVVALGESIHTSGDFYWMKFRMIRHLVRREGFRAVGIESSWDPAGAVSDYVASCEGDPRTALHGLFGIWDNTAVLEMVTWMCHWNEGHPDDPVVFFGFDEQQPVQDANAIREFLTRVGVPEQDPVFTAIDPCDGADGRPSTGENISAQKRDSCLQGLQSVNRYLRQNRKAVIAATSRDDFKWIKLRTLGLNTWERKIYARGHGDSHGAIEARDRTMATFIHKIRLLRAGRKVRTVIWAHDFHIAKQGESMYGALNMGTWLQKRYGDDYVAISVLSAQPDIDWPYVGCGPRFTVDAFPPGSIEPRLDDLGQEYLLVNLSFPGAARPFLEPGPVHLMNAFVQNFISPLPWVAPRDHYDGLVFLHHSRAMVPLAWVAGCPG